ncbi:exosortase F system-associated protein [Mangrovivirga sp. M17]|uniref:Exosortase F system-associated protein n=1 Tax=Mangrovivirga halotolerans TaxID=2993936 RepID=A0ABT3RU87_9BACT|nr:exosortase F system-associated protein [Mangrovivirga halotolerans]MCX2745216.1 exosortase F system-associated protein [Mangrovivirga halotolerans]
MSKESQISYPWRVVWIIVGLSGLAIVYITQKYGWVNLIGTTLGIETETWSKLSHFLVNRAIRFVLNDIFAITIIAGSFGRRDFVVFAVLVQLIGLFVFFIPYVILKIYYPTYNGPMINFIHRLILNPVLMILLIPALYIKQKRDNDEK